MEGRGGGGRGRGRNNLKFHVPHQIAGCKLQHFFIWSVWRGHGYGAWSWLVGWLRFFWGGLATMYCNPPESERVSERVREEGVGVGVGVGNYCTVRF